QRCPDCGGHPAHAHGRQRRATLLCGAGLRRGVPGLRPPPGRHAHAPPGPRLVPGLADLSAHRPDDDAAQPVVNAQATIFPTAAAPSDARAEGSAAIRVRHLTHRYRPARRRLAAPDRDRPALDDVSFDVRPGEVFGILGPNGGGKTTLFRILATLLRPRSGATTGEAFIFGHDVLRQPHA